MSGSPIDEVLEAAREALYARRAEALERVARVRAALDAYQSAVELDLAAQFAARNGLDARPAAPVVRAAMDLRSTIDLLPEIYARPPEPLASPSPSLPTLPPRATVPPAGELRA